ncbi:maleylpyruvate isomerase family mycothiol-dependent enzyme [Nonomuraea phyllanthi]|uniref:Maleylpyruvate isomerase family mycothiol-dependent enzyme n=1 Tax=Nonomuraea phyllanthi TaxID=2219224 RepID=A0A5C4W1Z2_9ACTN|nr:maleylpyruvate isomerase family mycothiol-dependent enzyme [Nonomuraea phyllanthi]KAB8191520.1 maleylpyruvate isomerase family mycothiol-dependent enzyme [Nonomuraea phyllanthi]QFY13153.1 maleylpyruvate isomerase family mycothiol-dependent enzyme [Nonomuraea phyllanthi]
MTVAGLSWVQQGTALFEKTLGGIDDAGLDAPSALPGWRRRHVVAHVASNADALVNLLGWARTGVENPMYSSPAQRAADIEAGAALPAGDLRAKLAAANARLAREITAMPEAAWKSEVRTARGRAVPASEVVWMRTREVWVHAADLDAGTSLRDVPADVLRALAGDAAAAMSARPDAPRAALTATDTGDHWDVGTQGSPARVRGELAEVTAYLLGRPGASPGPPLPAWL